MAIRKLRIIDLEKPNLSQSRVSIDPETIAKYKAAWEAGIDFPEVVVYQDGDKYHIADCFHRVQSLMHANLNKKIEHRTIACDVRSGTLHDAIKYSLGANLKHGLLPSTADKKRAVLLYYGLNPDNCAHSSNTVSKVVGCSHTFVSGWKATCISTPISIVHAETKIPIKVLAQTIEHLKAAQAEGKIVTTRNGKLLEQKVSPKALEAAVDEPLQMPLQESTVSSKALAEPALYIVTTTASIIPRGTVIEGWESLTDTGNIATDWEAGTVLIANEDLIEIPYSIDSKVTLIDREMEIEQTVTGYCLVGNDLKIQSIDSNGYGRTHSSTELKPYIKKDDEEKSTPPILDLSIFTTKQLEDIIATIGHEIYRRATLPQDMPHLSVC